MSYRVYAELSPKPFLPGDQLDVVTSDRTASFYINLEDWDGRYKFFIELDAKTQTLTTNELFDGEWADGFKIKANIPADADDTVLEISYKDDGNYILKFNGCEIERKSSYWPGEIRQVGGEADDLEVIVTYGKGHEGVPEVEIEDDLANEMLD
jgi:hypothetical protein